MKVIFKHSKKKNIDILYEFLECKPEAGADFAKAVQEMCPPLKEAVGKNPKEKRKIITKYINQRYKEIKEVYDKHLEKVEKGWFKVEDGFF